MKLCRLFESSLSIVSACACYTTLFIVAKNGEKSISVTDKQDEWIKSKIATGHFGNESEGVRELICERQILEEENLEEIEAIRSALIKGEQSGVGKKSVDKIWAEARKRRKARRG